MPESFVALERHGVGWNRLFGAIQQFLGAYLSGRPESVGGSHRGKGYGCECCYGSHPPSGRIKNDLTLPPSRIANKPQPGESLRAVAKGNS